ncbi:acyltransferase [Vibrio chagasii]|uniref:acyltransferase n=1 Tax=Vibrio chagasii TaxID=170679 RepID=UPI0022851932|nr:acyltransferase [Vibrio chagasii]MCY9826432.1 acyltransferase [Vibrio chagasii]
MIFEKAVIALFKIFQYRHYRVKYKLPSDFRFNGYFIRINGDGEFYAGKNCYISFFSYVNLEHGTKLEIGEKVSIGHNVKIYTSSFDPERLLKTGERQRSAKKDVKIGNNVLIGANVFICPGVVIGDNVVIGANSVVTHSLPSNSIVGGSPAKIIKGF